MCICRNPAVKTVVTTGQGRFYSNGFDLKWIAELGLESTLNFMRKYSQMLAKILTFPLTTVAAVNGKLSVLQILLRYMYSV